MDIFEIGGHPFSLVVISLLATMILSFIGVVINFSKRQGDKDEERFFAWINKSYFVFMIIAFMFLLYNTAFISNMERQEFLNYVKVNKIKYIQSTHAPARTNLKFKKKKYETLTYSHITYQELVDNEK